MIWNKERKRALSEILNRMVYGMFILLCIAMLLSTVLYVFFHGVEKETWDTAYIAEILTAGVIVAAFLFLFRRRMKRRDPRKEFRPVYAVLTICVISFFLQIVIVLFFKVEPRGDYLRFLNAAEDLAAGQPLRDSRYIALFPHILGYANFLAFSIHLFDRTGIAPFLNVVLNTASTGLIFFILYEITKNTYKGLLAGLFWSMYPPMLIYNCMVLSEPLYTALILLAILLFLLLEKRLESEKKKRLLSFVGIGFAFAVLLRMINIVRPVAGILIIALLIWIFILAGRKQFLKGGRYACLCFLITVFVVYHLGGAVWNAKITGQLGEEPASAPIYNLLTGLNTDVSGTHSSADSKLLMELRDQPNATAKSAQAGLIDPLKSRIRGMSISEYLRLVAEKMKIFAGNGESAVSYVYPELTARQFQMLRALSNTCYYTVVLLAAINTAKRLKNVRNGVLVLVPLYVLGLTIAHVLFLEVAGRYHYSCIPMLIILGASFLDSAESEENYSEEENL